MSKLKWKNSKLQEKSICQKKEKTLKLIEDLHHAFKTTLMHDYIVISWHNQDSE